ncbi:hypothetical protein TNCV_713091 [Trichonephila clavipes]|nr:hypothetical protein TNCV_713091 [Trichonephila clavipes]
MELEVLSTTTVDTSSTVSVPTDFRPLPSSTHISPVSSNFMIIFFKVILDMGPFADPFNDDIHAKQLSGGCHSDKTVLPVKLDLFCKGILKDEKRTLDEAHFWLNGYVNKQNCRIWSEANPQVYVETPLHPEKLTVWYALWAGGILFQNDEGHNVTVNGDRYRAMITNFFIP